MPDYTAFYTVAKRRIVGEVGYGAWSPVLVGGYPLAITDKAKADKIASELRGRGYEARVSTTSRP